MISIDWIEIPEGPTLLGVPMTEEQAAELPADSLDYPAETIHLPAYRISKFPVSVQDYRLYLEEMSQAQRLREPQFDTDEPVPVVGITWHEALDYCNWVSQQSGYQVRLPTAAEWQKAARGPDGWVFPYGNTFDPARCNTRESGHGRLTPVDAFPDGASAHGVFDMCGNCWEWTMTIWRNRELDDDEERLPTYAEYEDNSISKGLKTICGGAYTTTEPMARATTQYLRASDFTMNVQGFRLAHRAE